MLTHFAQDSTKDSITLISSLAANRRGIAHRGISATASWSFRRRPRLNKQHSQRANFSLTPSLRNRRVMFGNKPVMCPGSRTRSSAGLGDYRFVFTALPGFQLALVCRISRDPMVPISGFRNACPVSGTINEKPSISLLMPLYLAAQQTITKEKIQWRRISHF